MLVLFCAGVGFAKQGAHFGPRSRGPRRGAKGRIWQSRAQNGILLHVGYNLGVLVKSLFARKSSKIAYCTSMLTSSKILHRNPRIMGRITQSLCNISVICEVYLTRFGGLVATVPVKITCCRCRCTGICTWYCQNITQTFRDPV